MIVVVMVVDAGHSCSFEGIEGGGEGRRDGGRGGEREPSTLELTPGEKGAKTPFDYHTPSTLEEGKRRGRGMKKSGWGGGGVGKVRRGRGRER